MHAVIQTPRLGDALLSLACGFEGHPRVNIGLAEGEKHREVCMGGFLWARPGHGTPDFCSHSVAWDSVSWTHLTAREARKYGPTECLARRGHRFGASR